MRMKSYFAGSVQLAMEQARKELGSEAILVTSRLAPAEAGQPRQYEVVFATEMPDKSVPRRAHPTQLHETSEPAPQAAPGSASIEAVLGEIKGVRRQMDALISRQVPASIAARDSEREILAQLTKAEVEPDLARQLMAAALERLTIRRTPELRATEGRFAEVLRAAARKREATLPELRDALTGVIGDTVGLESGFTEGGRQTAIALVGPPGSGKTTLIAKLAIRYGICRNTQPLLLSADNQRVGAPDQLRKCAAVLGLRFEHTSSLRALGQLLDEHRNTELILIDTPGYSVSDLIQAEPLAKFLAGRMDIQRHLVVPANIRGTDIETISSAYGILSPTHLLFSRIDEAAYFGPVLNEAVRREVPLSFFSTGTDLAEDLIQADAQFITDRLLPASTASLSSGAAA